MPKYKDIKNLDKLSCKNLRGIPNDAKSGTDECICEELSPLESGETSSKKKRVRGTIRRAIASISGTNTKGREEKSDGSRVVMTTCKSNEKVKRGRTKSPKGDVTKVACRNCEPKKRKEFFLRHNKLNVEIIAPDISTMCSCTKNCLQDRLKNSVDVFIERVEVDNCMPKPEKESNDLQSNVTDENVTASGSEFGSLSTQSEPKLTRTYCVQRMQVDTMPTMAQKESDIFHSKLNGGSKATGSDKANISTKSSKLSRIGSKISQTGSLISQKLSKISHRGAKIADFDNMHSEFSVFLDAKAPEAKGILPPTHEAKVGLIVYDEQDESKSAHSTNSKMLN